MLFGVFFVTVDRGSAAAGDGVLWVTLGIQVGALPVTLLTALLTKLAAQAASGSRKGLSCSRWAC
jgi:hypothetical protein